VTAISSILAPQERKNKIKNRNERIDLCG